MCRLVQKPANLTIDMIFLLCKKWCFQFVETCRLFTKVCSWRQKKFTGTLQFDFSSLELNSEIRSWILIVLHKRDIMVRKEMQENIENVSLVITDNIFTSPAKPPGGTCWAPYISVIHNCSNKKKMSVATITHSAWTKTKHHSINIYNLVKKASAGPEQRCHCQSRHCFWPATSVHRHHSWLCLLTFFHC